MFGSNWKFYVHILRPFVIFDFQIKIPHPMFCHKLTGSTWTFHHHLQFCSENGILVIVTIWYYTKTFSSQHWIMLSNVHSILIIFYMIFQFVEARPRTKAMPPCWDQKLRCRGLLPLMDLHVLGWVSWQWGQISGCFRNVACDFPRSHKA